MGRPKGSKNKKVEVIENIPHGTSDVSVIEKPIEEKKEPIRKFSGIEDRQGPNEPLCLNCEHREDRHHTWMEIPAVRIEKDILTGKNRQVGYLQRVPNYRDKTRPCQHVCKCENYA